MNKSQCYAANFEINGTQGEKPERYQYKKS